MEDDRPITNPPSTHPDQQQLLGWQQQPQLGLLHRFTDLVEQLPLPCPEEATSTVVSPPDPVQLQGLLSQPSVLQGVQHALASTRMQHIVPRQSGPSLEPSPHDPVLSALLQGCPDLLRRTAPPRGMATPGPLQANTLGQPEVQQGVEDHLMSYTDPVAAAPHAVPATGSKAKPKEAATSERKAKRKRAARPKGSEEEGEGYEVQVAMDPDAAAGHLSGILTSMLGALEGRATEDQEEDEDGGNPSCAAAPPAAVGRLPPAKVQMLSGLLMSARSQGYLSKVPAAVLQHLLRTLHQVMVAGAAPVIPNSREKSLELTLVMDALEAAVAATYVLSTSGLPPEVYMEEVVQSVVQLAQHHMQVNVLAVLDDRYRRLWRPTEPASSLQTQGIMSSLKKGGQTPKTPRASKADPHLCRPSSYLDILLPPLQQLLVLLSDVLAAVKVDASQVLPLVRIMIGCLGVDALPRVFQVKAAGLAVAVFGALPEQRAVLLAELLSSTGLLGASSAAAGGGGGAASARSPPREFLAQDEPPIQIQVSTALLLQLIQATALLPAIEESDLQLIQDLCKVPIGWCDRLWVTLLEKLPAAKSASLDVKAFLDHFVQDLLAVQHTPEWPGAQLLLRRLVMALNTSKGLQHPESAVRLACIDLLGTITSAFMADCKQAEEEQEKVEALLAASGYDADAEREGGAYLGDEDKARVEALQRLLLGALAARPSSGTRHTARTLLVQQMLLQRAIFEQQQPPVMSSQPQDLIPPVEPPEPPAKGRKGRKGQAAAAAAAAQAEAEREKEQRRELALAQQGSALLAEFHALHAAPPRVAVGTDAGSAASISRWLLLNSAMGRGRGSFLLWLVNAGSAVGKGGGVSAGYQPTSTAERSRAVKALGSAIEMDERVLGHVDVQAAVCAALEDDAVSVREAAVELLGRHISHSPELAMTYFDLIGRASNDAGLSVRKRAVKVLWDCCVHCGSAAAPTGAYLDAGAPAFTRACEAVSLIMARAADPEDSMRKLATGLCAGLLFTSGSHPAVADADMEAAGGFPGASLAAAAKGSPSARAMLLAEVCDLVYHSDAPTNIKLPLPSDHSLVVVLKAILGQSSTSQPIAGGGGALAAQAAAVQQGAAELARALLEKTMELQEAAAAASGALDAALAGTSSRAHPAAAFAPAAAGSSAANGTGVGGPPDAGSPQRQGGAVPPPASAWPQGGGEAVPGRAFQGATEQEAVSGRGDARPNTHAATVAAAQASLGRAELQQLHCLLALHALCAADVGVLVQAHGGAAYFARGVAPYFKELVTVGDKSPAPSKRARSERVMCAMHIVAALAGRAEGGQTRLEAGLVKDLVSDLQLIIGRHLFVSVVSSAVQCMCALSRPHPNLVTQQIVGLAARYHLMLENDLNGGLTETSPYRSMYPKLLFILGNFCRYAAHILDSCAGMQVEVPSASTTSAGPAQAVSCRACLSLFLDFFMQGCSAQPAGVTPKVTEAALQAMGLLFTARPELMWEERGCLALLEDQLKPTSLLSHKARVLQNLIDLLKAEEEGLVIRQKKVEDEYLAQPSFGTLSAPPSMATTSAAPPAAAAPKSSSKASSATVSHSRGRGGNSSSSRGRGAGRGARSNPSSSSVANGAAPPNVGSSGSDATRLDGEGGAVREEGAQAGGGASAQVLAKHNGEGDVSSISSDVVRKLWPSILQAATDTGVQAQGAGFSMAGGADMNAVALQDAIRSAATVRRRVLELIEVAHRGGLTAPWDAIPALVALSTDPLPDTSARALRVLKQCCEHHAQLVPAKLAAGILNIYCFQMSLAMASAAVVSGDSGGARRPPRPPTPKELLQGGSLPEALGHLWSGVVAADRTRKAKFLSALLKPFEEASCLAMQGASKRSDVHLLAFCCAIAAELPYRKADEPLTLLTNINSIVVRRGQAAMDAIKQAMLVAAQSPAAHQHDEQKQQEAQQQQQAQQQQLLQQQEEQGTVEGKTAQVPYEVAAKASLAVSMLLLLKKFLREAYRLADDRVAAYAGPGGTVLASSKKMEEKAGVARDARIQLMLYDDVLDLSAPDHAPSSKPARELYKTIKYLISEDAANYRPPPSLNGELADGAAAAREDGGTAAEGAEGEEGGTLPSVARSAKPAAGRGRKRQPQQPKRKSKKKRWGNASSEEEEEEENEGEDGANAGQDSDDANFGPSKPAKRGRHAHAGKATAAGGGRGEGGGAQGGAAPRRAGSRQRKKKSGMEDYDEGSE